MVDYLRALLVLRTSEHGASAVEYAMLLALVGIIAGVAFGFGDVLGFIFKAALDDVSAKPAGQ